jgi:hypothetical protein
VVPAGGINLITRFGSDDSQWLDVFQITVGILAMIAFSDNINNGIGMIVLIFEAIILQLC